MYQSGATIPTPHSTLEIPSQPHLLRPQQHLPDPYDTDTNSILAPSTITPDTFPASQNPSTRHLLHHTDSSRSTIRAASICSSTAPLHPEATPPSTNQQRRATIAYLSDLRAARTPHPKPKKTKGRQAFELLSGVVDLVVPIDVDSNKTSMRQSSLGRPFKRAEKVGHGHGHNEAVLVGGAAVEEERRRSVVVGS